MKLLPYTRWLSLLYLENNVSNNFFAPVILTRGYELSQKSNMVHTSVLVTYLFVIFTMKMKGKVEVTTLSSR